MGQICVYLCITYGIVIIEIYSCNKELYTYKVAWFSLTYHLSVQRLHNQKMSIVYWSTSTHTHTHTHIYIYIYIYATPYPWTTLRFIHT